MAIRSWVLEQLIKVERHQPEMVERAMRDLLSQSEDLRWSVVVGAYLDGEISLSKAAEWLGMHPLALRERFIAQSIPLRLGPETPEEARAEVEAIESWRAGASGTDKE